MKKHVQIIFYFSILFSSSLISQAPELILTDTDGIEHNLYEDYLDQGKTVLIAIDAAWAGPSANWIASGVLDNFHNDYTEFGDAVVLWIEWDPTTNLDDLNGTGTNGIGYDFITDHPYPKFNPPFLDSEEWGIAFFPTIRIICPDGTVHTDTDGFPQFTYDESVFYGNFPAAENIVETMINLCGTDFNLNNVTGTVYSDLNNDCEEQADEIKVEGITATVSGTNGEYTRVTNSNGKFTVLPPMGDYTVEIEPPSSIWTVCNNSQEISFSGTDESIELDFGLQATVDCIDLNADISSPFLRRCFDSSIFVDYCNNGSVTGENITIQVQLNDDLSYVSSTIPFTNQSGNLYTFEVEDLDPWECGTFQIIVYVNCEVELGTELCFNAEIFPSSDCNVLPRVLGLECQEVVGAFDPNDKRAFPLSGSDEYRVLPNSDIKYQIRFQNTGTDTAFNVYVQDMISDNLDLSTFKAGTSSHPYRIEFVGERVLRFYFDNIMLPDSNVNLLGSNGFVNYYIEQNADLPNDTEIKNFADIFFDFNLPVRTNTTTHIVDDMISGLEEESINEISMDLSPNPAKDNLNLRIHEDNWTNGQVNIIDLQGKMLSNQNVNNRNISINISHLTAGVYFVQLNSAEGKTTTRKIVVID